MNRIRAQLLSLVALSLLVLSIISVARFKADAQGVTKQDELASDPVLKEISNYRQWTRVNETPLPVLSSTKLSIDPLATIAI